ncbi:MAG: hypothetical protein ACE5GV_04485 [Candidatus Scalindua sp.]
MKIRTIKEMLTKAQEELKKLDADLATLQKLKNKHTEITKLSLVDQIMVSNFLSNKETYTELFARQIKEKSQDEADVKIKAHFEKHKKFIETAKDQIPQEYIELGLDMDRTVLEQTLIYLTNDQSLAQTAERPSASAESHPGQDQVFAWAGRDGPSGLITQFKLM